MVRLGRASEASRHSIRGFYIAARYKRGQAQIRRASSRWIELPLSSVPGSECIKAAQLSVSTAACFKIASARVAMVGSRATGA